MPTQLPLLSFALLAAAVVNLVLAGIAWRRRAVAGAKPFVVLLLSVTGWAIAVAVRATTPDHDTYALLDFVVNVMTAIVAPTVFLFAIEYTGREGWLSRRRLALLAVEPVLLTVLLVTFLDSPLTVEIGAIVRREPVVTRQFIIGPVFLAHIIYAYTLVVAGLGLLGQQVLRTSGAFRKQAILMFVSIAVPFALNVLWFVGFSPIPEEDPTPFGFTVSGVAITAGLFFFDLLDLSPVARHALIEGMEDVVIAVDHRDRITDANPEAVRVVDVETDLLVGASAPSVIPEYDRLVSDTVAEDGSTDNPGLELTVDGQRRYFNARVTPLEDGRGERIGRLLVLRDVTERRQVERRFQELIENATDLITVLDADGTVQYASPSTRSILGYDPAELTGENAFEYVHPDDRESLRENFRAAVGDPGATATTEYRIRASDGDWRHLESRSRNLLQNPVVEGFVVNARDVTERVAYRRELERQNEQLERFASVVSHDLRNPINVIMGRVDLARESEDVADHLDSIEESADRMTRLVDDLLALAREGQTVEETEPVALATVAEDAWQTVDTNRASLVVDTDRTVEADPDRLRQAFTNLYRNAVEHGGSDVTVRVVDTSDGFAVEDDGPGIPPEEREQVFEWGHTTEPLGTGYGLAIVERIVEAHGWTVTVVDAAAGEMAAPDGDGTHERSARPGARFEVRTG